MKHVSVHAFFRWLVESRTEGEWTVGHRWAAVKEALAELHGMNLPTLQDVGIMFEANYLEKEGSYWSMVRVVFAFEYLKEYAGQEEVVIEYFGLEHDTDAYSCVDVWMASESGLDGLFERVEEDKCFVAVAEQRPQRVVVHNY